MAALGSTFKVLTVFENEARGERESLTVKLGNTQSIKCRGPVKSFGYGGLFKYCLVVPKVLNGMSHLYP